MYVNIDFMPIKTWFKISGSNDLGAIAIRGKYTHLEMDSMWTILNQQFIDAFGMDEKFAEKLRLTKQIIGLELDLIITGDQFIKNYINVAKAEMLALGEVENRKFEDVLADLMKIYPHRIDPLTTTVMEYYSFIKNAR